MRRPSPSMTIGFEAGLSWTGFGLPDRNDPLDLVHRPGACRERLGPVCRGARDDDGVPSDRDATDAMHDRHVEDPEFLPRAFDELRQGAQGHRPVDFVVQGPHVGIRSDRAEEDDNRPRVIAPHRVHDRVDVDPVAVDLGGDPLEIGVEGFREPLAGGLRSSGPEVPERLDPAPAPLLVMPEIQIRPAADRLRRHATTELHDAGIWLTLFKVNRFALGPESRGGPPLHFHWKRSWADGPFGRRWTSSWCPSWPTSGRSPPS